MDKQNMDYVRKLLSDPDTIEILRKVLADMMTGAYSTHRVINLPELAHVDPAILQDLRTQGYQLFERASGLNALLHIFEHKQANDFIHEMFAQSFVDTDKREEDLKKLSKAVLSTYAPALLKEIMG